jgi:hypothetical protein
MTASTSGPGSAFHGSLASRWALVPHQRQVASSATEGCTTPPHAAAAAS